MKNNLSKVFKYINDAGDGVTFTYENGYLINKPDGIDAVSVSLAQAHGFSQVGVSVQMATVQPRAVVISGILVGDDQASRKDRLLSVFRPDIPGKLYADDYYLDCYVNVTPVIGPQPKFAGFSLSLFAPYPYWQSTDEQEKSLVGVNPLFKFPWNISKKYQFGELIRSTLINVYNGGQVPVPYTMKFVNIGDAGVVNPNVWNVTTNKHAILNKTIAIGERVVLQTTHDTTSLVSSVDGDIRGLLDIDSDFFELAVGDNVIQPSAESGLSNLDLTISFGEELLGVTV